MGRETRTKLQIEADRLDLEIFRLVERLEQFAVLVKPSPKASSIRVDAWRLDSARYTVREFMHRRDREATSPRPALSEGPRS